MKKILLGNEAIVQGALEAGVQFVSTYPGTPSSEIGNVFSQIAKENGVYFEFSTNEKVALEAAIGASFSGLKSLVAMKDFGLNVCSDSLIPFCYTGTKGPTVIVAGDDPSCWSSAQSEQNSRAFAYLAHIPILEPSDPAEAKEFVKFAFDVSDRFDLPIMIRTTTRVAHQRMPVEISNLKSQISNLKGEFIKDKKRFVTLPPRVLEMKAELLEKIEEVRNFAEKSKENKIVGNTKAKIGIITSGVSYLYVKEALEELRLDLPVLKLAFFYPLPEEKIKGFIKNLKGVLIVEELDPYLEKEIKNRKQLNHVKEY
jgi:indolepyruvate ferredoxin oxidoreductase alpha subunit